MAWTEPKVRAGRGQRTTGRVLIGVAIAGTLFLLLGVIGMFAPHQTHDRATAAIGFAVLSVPVAAVAVVGVVLIRASRRFQAAQSAMFYPVGRYPAQYYNPPPPGQYPSPDYPTPGQYPTPPG
jgi:hypothetical protein